MIERAASRPRVFGALDCRALSKRSCLWPKISNKSLRRRRGRKQKPAPRKTKWEREIERIGTKVYAARILLRLQGIENHFTPEQIAGDVHAIREVGDRMDGRVPQAITGDADGDPITLRTIVTGVKREGDK